MLGHQYESPRLTDKLILFCIHVNTDNDLLEIKKRYLLVLVLTSTTYALLYNADVSSLIVTP
jgi:hypothetical protein